MKKSLLFVLLSNWIFLPSLTWADDFCQNSKVTQVAGDVAHGLGGVWSQQTNLNDVFTVGEELKTGVNSRAELTSADSTVIRVGASSILSFNQISIGAVSQWVITNVGGFAAPVRPPEQVLQAQAPLLTETISLNGTIYLASVSHVAGQLFTHILHRPILHRPIFSQVV